MRAHIIVNNIVINTVEVDSLTHPDGLLMAWAIGASDVGDTYDGTVFTKPPPPLPTSLTEYSDALVVMYNAKAAERRYDNYITCTMRSGYTGPFQSEGKAFGTWMDTCNAYGYGVLEQFQSGAIAQPSVIEFLAMVDVNVNPLVWPAQ